MAAPTRDVAPIRPGSTQRCETCMRFVTVARMTAWRAVLGQRSYLRQRRSKNRREGVSSEGQRFALCAQPDADIGRQIREPCKSSHPHAFSRWYCAGVSMPSATTCMLKDFAICRVALTMGRLPSSIARMKLRSSLSSVTGKVCW